MKDKQVKITYPDGAYYVGEVQDGSRASRSMTTASTTTRDSLSSTNTRRNPLACDTRAAISMTRTETTSDGSTAQDRSIRETDYRKHEINSHPHCKERVWHGLILCASCTLIMIFIVFRFEI